MTLGVAVVGLGVGLAHARAFAADSRCSLRWLIDLDPDRARCAANELGSPGVAPSFQAALADPEVDVVSIASYDECHFEQALAALEAGKHVFCEKPLCGARAEARALDLAIQRSGRLLQSNLVLRAAPLWRWLRESIRAGQLGRIYAIDGDYLYGRLEKITEGWRKDTPGYSVILGGGVHLVDLMMWLTGERPEHVTAAGSRLCTEGTAFRFHDFVAATFQFASGMVGRVTANFGCVHPHQHVLRVFGTLQTFLYDDRGPRMFPSRDPDRAPMPIDLSAQPASKGALVAGFVDAIVAGHDRVLLARRELDLIHACLAADEALGGATTRIEYR